MRCNATHIRKYDKINPFVRCAGGRDAIPRNQYASLADLFGGELPAIYAAKDFVTAELQNWFFFFFFF